MIEVSSGWVDGCVGYMYIGSAADEVLGVLTIRRMIGGYSVFFKDYNLLHEPVVIFELALEQSLFFKSQPWIYMPLL